MGRIPDAFIREILERTDLLQLIGRHVQLKGSSGSYKGLCPFHGEKTPSFYVHPAKQYYHCFGCSAHGNAIDFLMQHDQLPFLDAVDHLAHLVGMEVPRSEQADKVHQRRAHINDTLSHVQTFFQKQREHNQSANHYLLNSRGLSSDIVQQFGLGLAPSQGHLMAQSFTPKDHDLLLELGLLSLHKGRQYARFRDRITFPIRDERGRLIAFGARALLEKQQPKYLNTVFDKHIHLYGLYEALKAKHPSKILIVVEGYLDVIMMAQHGLGNAVAGLGTAIGVKQIKLLFRYTKKVLFCFDGDKAGYAAAEKALRSVLQVLSDGIEVKFVFLPEKEDPDSMLRNHGKSALLTHFQKSLTLEDFFLHALSCHFPSKSIAHQAAKGKLGMSWIENMPMSLVKQLLTKKLANMVGLKDDDVEKLMPSPTSNKPEQKTESLKSLSPLQHTLSLILQHPKEAAKITPPKWLDMCNQSDCILIRNAIKYSNSFSGVSVGAFIEHWRNEDNFGYIKCLAYWQHLLDENANWHNALEDAFLQAELFLVTNSIERILVEARKRELDNNSSEKLVALMKRKNDLRSGHSE